MTVTELVSSIPNGLVPIVLIALTYASFLADDAAVLDLEMRLVASERHDVLDVVRVFGRAILHPEPDVVVVRLKLPTAEES